MKKSTFFWLMISLFISISSIQAFSFFDGYYVPNKGQWQKDVLFLARGNGYNMFITNDALNFDYFTTETQGNSTIKHGHLVKMQMENANLTAFNSFEPSEWKLSFFYGNNPSNWAKDVQGFKILKVQNIYNNIDLLLKFEENNPRYDFIVKPGGNPSDIVLKFNGAYTVSTDGKTIRYYTRFGEIVNANLFAYQEENGIPVEIPCKFIQKGQTEFTFAVDNYDRSKELIIDPIVMMSYFGGSNEDKIVALKELSTGILLAAGWTESINFPTTEGAYDNTYNDIRDGFICKFDLRGAKRNLIYGTFFGGSGTDYIAGLSVDVDGYIYVGGSTNSPNFPLNNQINNSIIGLFDAFATKFTPDLNSIVYSTYIGGSKDDIVTAAQVGPDKGFYVCGYTESTDIPTTGGAIQPKLKGRKDIFIIKLSSSGKLIDYATYLGGGVDDVPYAMAVSEIGNIFITGATKSEDFPMAPYRTRQIGWQTVVTESPYDRTFNGGWDAFAVKILGDGGKLDFSTFFGGTADDIGTAVAYTADQKIIFAGITYKETTNPSFPISQTAYQNTHKGGVEIFVAGLSNIISSQQGGVTYKRQDLDFSTFLGGSSNDYLTSIILSGKYLHLLGYTNSSNFPVVNNPTGRKIGKYDIFYAQMSSDGSTVNFSDIYGTVDDDSSSAFYLAPGGDFYIAGQTNSQKLSTIYPISGSGYQGTNNILLMKYSATDLRIDYPVGKEKLCPNSNLNIRWNSETLTATDTFSIDIKVGTNPWEKLIENVKGLSYTWNIPPSFHADSVWLRISHSRGIIATHTNPFSIYELPSIVESGSYPQNTVVCEGDSIVLYMKGRGSDIKYQWLYNGSPISGATDTVLVIRNVNASKKGQYKGIVSGPCPATAETPVFNVDFIPATKILSQTSDTTVKKFEKLVLYVNAAGDNLTYQWYKDDSKLIGATQSIFEIQNVSKADEGIYKCKVAGTCGEVFTQAIKVEVDTNVASVETNSQSPVVIYNLETNTIVIQFPEQLETEPVVKIYNTIGQVLSQSDIHSEILGNTIYIQIRNLNTGIYFVELEAGKNIIRSQIPITK